MVFGETLRILNSCVDWEWGWWFDTCWRMSVFNPCRGQRGGFNTPLRLSIRLLTRVSLVFIFLPHKINLLTITEPPEQKQKHDNWLRPMLPPPPSPGEGRWQYQVCGSVINVRISNKRATTTQRFTGTERSRVDAERIDESASWFMSSALRHACHRGGVDLKPL